MLRSEYLAAYPFSPMSVRKQLNLSTFPQEIYDQIIYECSLCFDEDWIIPFSFPQDMTLRERTLSTCALTCRAWTYSSQRHLFRTIWVNTEWPEVAERKIALLTRALRANSSLGRMIKILRISTGV
ncbi:hypothetical protein K474DRAFT_483599 [Panus rudis PR-1116 ss-1]|nr:hypothetical protein K474DRAFT_483599 [Panus rudis PR-1116 ss-1]